MPWCLPKKNPKCTKKKPVCTKKTSLLTLPQWTPTTPIYTNQNTLSTKKKKQLSSPCMLHLWTVVYQKANLVAPFHTKKPQDGLPPGFLLSTTFYNSHTPPAPKQNTERTLTFSSMTFHSLSYLHA